MDEDSRSMTNVEIVSSWFLLKSKVVQLNVKESIAPVFLGLGPVTWILISVTISHQTQMDLSKETDFQ